ncbi:MAG TPA: hypothetical protein VKX16_04705 [Chloroflexota bacterium]|nr:hypothetical protein [Chloroflexota bacterium]
MRFLVMGENIDPGYLLPPEQTVQSIEMAVIPSFQILAQWEQEGRVRGGLYPGERAGAFILEAASFEELDAMMNQLPFFGLVKWTVKPLMDWQTTARQVAENVSQFKQMIQQGGQP